MAPLRDGAHERESRNPGDHQLGEERGKLCKILQLPEPAMAQESRLGRGAVLAMNSQGRTVGSGCFPCPADGTHLDSRC